MVTEDSVVVVAVAAAAVFVGRIDETEIVVEFEEGSMSKKGDVNVVPARCVPLPAVVCYEQSTVIAQHHHV